MKLNHLLFVFIEHKARILVRDYTGKYAWDCRPNFSGRLLLSESDTEKPKSPYLSHILLYNKEEHSTSSTILNSSNISVGSNISSDNGSSGSGSERIQRRQNQTTNSPLEIANERRPKKIEMKPLPLISLPAECMLCSLLSFFL
jgi:hypothetical protein